MNAKICRCVYSYFSSENGVHLKITKRVQISACRSAMLTEVFLGFTQFLQANARIVPYN
jgi:hypothetical protein